MKKILLATLALSSLFTISNIANANDIITRHTFEAKHSLINNTYGFSLSGISDNDNNLVNFGVGGSYIITNSKSYIGFHALGSISPYYINNVSKIEMQARVGLATDNIFKANNYGMTVRFSISYIYKNLMLTTGYSYFDKSKEASNLFIGAGFII